MALWCQGKADMTTTPDDAKLVERLRAEAENWKVGPVVLEAAATIERLRAELTLRQLLPRERQIRLAGFDEGFSLAHERASCGHVRANWLDPQYGTPEYAGNEKCEACAIEARAATARSTAFREAADLINLNKDIVLDEARLADARGEQVGAHAARAIAKVLTRLASLLDAKAKEG